MSFKALRELYPQAKVGQGRVMVLSSADKAIAEAAHARSKGRPVIPGAMLGIPLAGMAPTLINAFRNPHTSRGEILFYSAFLGFAFAASIVASFFISRQRKRDLEIVRFFEKHFPEDCSWKQEEKILAAAEDLRLKAKIDHLIHSQA